MSITGLSASSFYSASTASSLQQKFQQIQQEFKQLGQDLQSGNLAQAQSDFTTLRQNLPIQQQSAATNSQTTSHLQEAVAQLAQDLKSGNLTAAQSDLVAVQKATRQQGTSELAHNHRHHGHAQDANSSQAASLFSELGQELQSGNLNGAQQAYAALQEEFQQFTGSTGSMSPSSTLVSAGNFNVSI